MRNKYTLSQVIAESTKLGIKGIKLGFIGLGYGLGVANKVADSAITATKDGISLSKAEQSDESQDSSPIDSAQDIKDVRLETFERFMEKNPDATWEEFSNEFSYMFHPDELILKENGETEAIYGGIK